MRGSLQVPDEHCLAKPLESASPIAFARPAVTVHMQSGSQNFSDLSQDANSANLLNSGPFEERRSMGNKT